VLKQDSLTTVESALKSFEKDVETENFYNRGLGDFLVSCIGPGFTDDQFLEEVSCNVIPVLELFADARDSLKCVSESDKTVFDEFVCDVTHVASGYDFVQYGAVIASVGAAEGVTEGGDVALSGIKTVLKRIAKSVDETIVDVAAKTIKKNPGAFAIYLKWTLQNLNNWDEIKALGKAWVEVLGRGDIASKETFKILDDYGLLTGKQVESLGRAVKGLSADSWSAAEKEGLYKITKNFPESKSADGLRLLPPLSDSALIGVKRSSDLGETNLKQIMQYSQENSENLKFQKVIPSSPTGQDADMWFKINNKEYWVEATQLEEKVTSTVPIGEHILQKADKFKFATNQDNTINIKLLNGTSLSKQEIENQIIYEFNTNPQIMQNVTRVQIYDAITDEIIEVKYWS
jgi:hypothetical protein